VCTRQTAQANAGLTDRGKGRKSVQYFFDGHGLFRRNRKLLEPFIFNWKQFERWDFAIWQGAWGDAVQAPLAVRDDAQSAKGQAHTIPFKDERL
jgi:hypothetical protein